MQVIQLMNDRSAILTQIRLSKTHYFFSMQGWHYVATNIS